MNSQKFCSLHTHTIFCDGRDDVETMCRAAYEKKLDSIGFSAHAPIDRQIGAQSDWNLKDEKVAEYVSEVLAARERWHDKLKVFLGYEADYIKGRRSPLDADITELNLDYIIGSVHYLFPADFNAKASGARFFTVDGSKEEFENGLNEGFNGDAKALMHCYYDAQLEMIEAGGFDILGHPDLLKKNCHGKNYWTDEEEAVRQKEVALAAGKAGIIIEVNTGGINRKKISDVYPSLSFLRIISEYNIPVLITADAHCAGDINGNYNIALNTIKLADIKEHYILSDKINKKLIWHKEEIL
ncbi:MAG: histidinol-phosphatase [Treponema sp.]|nr:histidinol-phosphatase [Treponema sp.]